VYEMKLRIKSIKENRTLYTYVRQHSVTYRSYNLYSSDGEIRCWRTALYAVDEERPRSILQILPLVVKKWKGGMAFTRFIWLRIGITAHISWEYMVR